MGICIFSVRHKLSSKQYRYGVVISNELGCCWIATYNALKLLKDEVNPENEMNPEDIIREYESYGLFLQGHHGIHPYAMASFFKDRGYDVKVSFSDFDNTAKAYEANIIYIERNSLGHFVAVKYDGEDFYGYNTFCNNSTYDYLGKQISVIDKYNKNQIKVASYNTKILISITPKEQTTVV